MMSLREWLTRVSGTLGFGRSDADLEEELRLHLDLAIEDARRRGLPPEEAARAATLKSGTVAQAMHAQRDQRALPWLEDLARDLRHTGRMLCRAPGFTAVAVLSLALGIGANTAIFTLMDALLFRTVSVDQPDRLFFLGHDPGPQLDLSSNYPLFERYRTASVFSGVTAYRARTFRVRTLDGVEEVAGQYVSGNYHAVVGAPMALGRGFVSHIDRRSDDGQQAVISYDYWMTRFGGRRDILGQAITIADRSFTIIGVTAHGYQGLNAGERLQITLPLSVLALDSSRFFDDHDAWIGLTIVGRLAPGVSDAQALAAVEVLFQQFIQDPENGWAKLPNRDRFRSAALVPAARGTFWLRQQYAKPLWVLMSMVAVLLIVACANVAILFLARAADRSREMAVRLSIGAGRSRLIRQLLTETVVLALLGGGAGVTLAIWGTRVMLSVFAIGPSPSAIDATLNLRVLAASAAVALLTGIAFGIMPAIASTRVDLARSLKGAGSVMSGGRRELRGKALVVAQVALCIVLVTGAGLLAASLRNLRHFDAGFSRDRVTLADIDLVEAHLTPADRLRAFGNLLERLRAAPGVQAAAFSSRTPIDDSVQLRRIEVAGFEATPLNGVSSNSVSPGYFRTFGLKVIRGRDFADDDRQGNPAVAVVSESMAQHFFGNDDPIGRTFVLSPNKDAIAIVGVVADARHERLRSDTPTRMVYLPLAQISIGVDGAADVPHRLAVSIRTSTSADPSAAASMLRNAARSISTTAMVSYVRTIEQQVDAVLIPERLLTMLSTGFASIALLLACVGLYGVMAHNVSRRTREIGLRLALGALPGAILAGVIHEVLVVWAIGAAIGLSMALAATRLLSSFLFGLTPRDPVILAGTGGILLAIALIAGFIPARRAAATSPMQALNQQ